MKKIILFVFTALLCSTAIAQSDVLKKYMRFTPSNLNASNVNPSDIPSEQVLLQMGLSETEIQEAMDFKYQRGKYHPNALDSSAFDLKNNEGAKAGFNISKNVNGFDLKFDYENYLSQSQKGNYLANLSVYKIY